MAFNFSRKAPAAEGEAAKPNQKKKMLLLIIIIALFGYLYFFTGLLKPNTAEKSAELPKQESSSMVKKPIPGREAVAKNEEPSAVNVTATAPPKAEEVNKPAVPPAPPAKPAAPPTPSAKPVPPAEKPAPPPKPAPVAKPAASPQQKTAPVAKAAPAPAAAKPAVEPKKKAEALPVKDIGKFTLLVGEFPEGKLLKEVKANIRKAGVGPIKVKSGAVNKQMHRLLVGEYTEHDQALKEVYQLKKKGVDAFLGDSGDKYVVYAGSYLYPERAEIERDRLLKMGLNPSIVKNEISVKLAKVTAGRYPDAEKAQAAVEKLKAHGLVADVVEVGK